MHSSVIQILNSFVVVLCGVLNDLNEFPDYDNPHPEYIKDIRQSFINTRKRNDATATRIQLLDKYITNNTVFVDEIAHFEISKNNSEWTKVNEIENEFRNLIGMQGLTYIYKRDIFWRTWRLVHYPGNKDKVVSYVCIDSLNITKSFNCYWVIEEKPTPCPYELFSMSSLDDICAVHINQYHDAKNSCSSDIDLNDLTGVCDNPIITEWRIEKKFSSKVSERFPSFICGGREFCTIVTLYKIADDYISFRILNATNDVIYSRIMKPGKRNFACINDCGRMDLHSKTIKKEKPLKVNLLGKKKREDTIYDKHAQLTFTNANQFYNNDNNYYYFRDTNNKANLKLATKTPTCKTIKLSQDINEDDE